MGPEGLAAEVALPRETAATGLSAALRGVLPPGCVRDDADALREFSRDCTEAAAGRPDVVARPPDAAGVAAVLRIAAARRVPVVPVVSNWNVGGLAVPDRGGIVLDLRGLDRIVEVNEADLYMTIEAGVTWKQVRERLDRRHPGLRFAYPLAPPESSVLANCLLDGLTTLSLRHGAMADWLNGIEVALPTGEVVRTGTAAFGAPPVSRSPLPGLQGLFVSAQGTTGIAVRGTVQLWRKPAASERFLTFRPTLEEAFALARSLVAADCCEDIGVVSAAVGRLLLGDPDPRERGPGEPEAIVVAEVAGATRRQFRARRRDFGDVLRETARAGARAGRPVPLADLAALEPSFGVLSDLPARFDALLDPGGLSWVGTYGPMSRLERGSRRGLEVLAAHGFPPLLVARPMRGGHFAVLRLIEVFDRRDAAAVARVASANGALAEALLDEGFVPYKTPPAILARLRDRLDPGFAALWKRARAACDPTGVLNPGRWDP
ncbi:MAG: FAD-binding oxidoreductase [Planctomycetales bacterium]|nr:FAD-binding oxidoreductase [Planctomycetales bacterium]